jgi:hypothetical protein
VILRVLRIGLTFKVLSALLSEARHHVEIVTVAAKVVRSGDQECGKNMLNGTALDPWVFNPRFSCAGRVTSPIPHRAARKVTMTRDARAGRRAFSGSAANGSDRERCAKAKLTPSA